MGQPLYSYTDEAIIRGIEAIRRTHNQIDTALDNLELSAERQLESWEGGAREQYYMHKKEWDAGVNSMKDVMTTNAIPALTRTLENYQNTEKINTQAWQTG